ncbi:class I SAM-dependent methyltransferase [Sphingobacterium deserti]|uniref:Type 11 methyltransferase n=1 Tax=Sphingobacterium deserti TaxID=1229276 RepID=A0A0B8SYU7_9SPHI|nr:class I SAM-dependent methyltransferase [Sphingobacterium deserti]KGE12376.1 type 11 methyltransferase [Sphingobacterium deserti]
MATIDELKRLAAQLAHPSGEEGLRLAQMMEETNYGMTKQAWHALSVQPGQHVLELGHGNASHVTPFLAANSNVHYSGLEISTSMHQLAMQVNQASIVSGRADFRLYDGQEFPYPLASFSCIFAVNTIYFIDDPATFTTKLSGLLAKNGKLAFTFATKSFMEMLPFTAYGFNLYEQEDVLRFADPDVLTLHSIIRDKEMVLSKNGDEVEREFVTIVWSKI